MNECARQMNDIHPAWTGFSRRNRVACLRPAGQLVAAQTPTSKLSARMKLLDSQPCSIWRPQSGKSVRYGRRNRVQNKWRSCDMTRFRFQLISQRSISAGMNYDCATSTAADAVDHEPRGFLHRILDAVTETRHRDMEREIQRVIGRSGEHLSDEIERRIAEHLMRNSSF